MGVGLVRKLFGVTSVVWEPEARRQVISTSVVLKHSQGVNRGHSPGSKEKAVDRIGGDLREEIRILWCLGVW